MDIRVGRCNKPVQCAHCLESITVGEIAIFGKIWYRQTSMKHWSKNLHWHGKRSRDGQCCWLVQAIEYLASKPYVETRGRRAILMSKEKRDERLCLLRQRARLVQRLKLLMTSPDQTDIDKVIVIGSKIETLKEQIALVGGIPKSWM